MIGAVESGETNGARLESDRQDRLRFFFFSSRRRHTRLVSDWSSDVCSSDLDDFANSLVDIQEFSARRQFPDERPNSADHLARTSSVPYDATERLSDFIYIRRLRAEPTQPCIRIGDDRGYRLVNFVCDRGRHLPQQHDAIEAREIGFGLLQSLLCTFAISDVDDDGAKEGWRAVCRGNNKRGDIGPYDLAVLASVALALQNPDGTATDTLLGRRPIVLMSDLQCCEISQLPLGIAGHLLEALVRCEIPPVLKIEHCNA